MPPDGALAVRALALTRALWRGGVRSARCGGGARGLGLRSGWLRVRGWTGRGTRRSGIRGRRGRELGWARGGYRRPTGPAVQALRVVAVVVVVVIVAVVVVEWVRTRGRRLDRMLAELWSSRAADH